MTEKYSLKQSADKKLSKNFTVKEFACKDKSDTVYIDTALVSLLQRLRSILKKPITINSAYRTKAYNEKIGGAKSSYHCKGQAADIVCSGKTILQIARTLEALGAKGIIMYTKSNFVHTDTRSRKYFAKDNGNPEEVSTFFNTVTKNSTQNQIKEVQERLKAKGFYKGKIDGIWGAQTEYALKSFQKKNKLSTDGICGAESWGKLYI